MSMLGGIRVVELSDGFVDLGGRMLAELGAEVLAVSSGSADTPERTVAFHHGKTRLAPGATALPAVLAEADVLLDGRRLGDVHQIKRIQVPERLVHVIAHAVVPRGDELPRPATDLTLMAASGLMTVTGEPGRPPLTFPGTQAYALTGIQVATAALLGLQASRRTGRGQRIDVSALQSVTLANYREAVMFEWTGRIGTRQGNRLVRGKSGVRQVWPCADGFVTWSMIDNPGMMRAVVAVLAEHGAAGELADVDWQSILVADLPQQTIDRWEGVIARFFAEQPRDRLASWSLEKGWGLSVIHDIDDVRQSAHLAARGLFVEVRDETAGRTVRLPGPLFRHGAGADVPERVLQPLKDGFEGWGQP